MKQDDKQRVLFDAVTEIDGDLIEETAAPLARTFPKVLRRLTAVAAAVAIFFTALVLWPTDDEIITGPGLLTITVHAVESGSDTYTIQELDTRDFFLRTRVSTFSNSMPGIPLRLSVEMEDFPSEEITFEVSTSCGEYISVRPDCFLLIPDFHAPTITTQNNSEIYWNYSGDIHEQYNPELRLSTKFDIVFTRITVYCEGHIIGYAVFALDRIYSDEVKDDPLFDSIHSIHQGNYALDLFWVELVTSASFPKVDGEYQEITQEYVSECIAKSMQ